MRYVISFLCILVQLFTSLEPAGENPSMLDLSHGDHLSTDSDPGRVYGNTRMDNVWAFREAYVVELGSCFWLQSNDVQLQQGASD